MANSTQIISQIIDKVDDKIIRLEKRETINVVMRIDEIIPFLKEVLELAKTDEQTRRYDLTLNKTGQCTVTYTVNGTPISAGSNVLKNGDKLTITVTPGTGYHISQLKVNNKNYVSGTEITVDNDITVKVIAALDTFDLATSTDGNCTIAVTSNSEPITPGEDVLTYGSTIKITAAPSTGYELNELKVNGTNFTNGGTMTVTDNVSVTAAAALEKFDLTTTPAENSSITVTKNGNEVTPGLHALTYGDTILISATASEGYQVTALTINGEDYVSDQTVTVTSDITVTTTVTPVL